MLVFEERGKPKPGPEEATRSKERTSNKLNPHMKPGPGIEPGPHWWETPLRQPCSPNFQIFTEYACIRLRLSDSSFVCLAALADVVYFENFMSFEAAYWHCLV